MDQLIVKNLNKTYPGFKLDNVNFSLKEGRIAGFIGRNGAGKTTTIKSLLNLVHCDNGEIICFGKSLKDHELEIKKQIGYSTGSVNWYPRKKIKDIMQVVKRFYDDWDERAYRRYLTMFSLDEEKTPNECSEGMKVKINLLIALSHNAKLLILDEPTSGLDPFSRDELLSLFIALKNEGIAILFSTHIISDIERCVDDIIYISKGKIIDTAAKDEFIAHNKVNNETLEEIFLRLERKYNHVEYSV